MANDDYLKFAQDYDEEVFQKYRQELFSDIWLKFFHKFTPE